MKSAAPEVPYPKDEFIQSLFETQVQLKPEATAVEFSGQRLSYKELNAEANQLAHTLIGMGLAAGDRVGLCIERSADAVLAMLAILKAGGAYVPLDPTSPHRRLSAIIGESGIEIVVTREALRSATGSARQQVILDTDRADIATKPTCNPSTKEASRDLAYVIFTSGSTGKPKGVAVPHRAVLRLVIRTNYVRLEARDRIAHLSSISFDAATFEVWGALLNGATMVILERDDVLSPNRLALKIRQKAISTMFVTTALFNLIAREKPDLFAPVENLLFGGETANLRWVREVLRRGPPKNLLHVYGPTENTTFTTWHQIRDLPEDALTVPIGTPIAKTYVHVLDRNLQPVPPNVAGELYIGGEGLATGYLNQPQLTRSRFISDPFKSSPQRRLYRSGDIVRRRADGDLEFVGRTDDQVKLRGFRIELGEIETALRRHPMVSDSLVAVRETETGDKSLVAYVSGKKVTECELRDYLREFLPEYMIPNFIVSMDRLPVGQHGKIDRSALPNPTTAGEAMHEPMGEYTTELALTRIWEELLATAPVPTDASFFELGGDSLLAAQCVSRIEKTLGKQVALSTFFKARTIDALAKILSEEDKSSSSTWIAALKPEGSRPPFFCVGGAAGLAPHLEDEQPFYFLSHSMAEGDPKLTTVEQVARELIVHLREVQPEGPYYLGGYSIGGMLAFEMAQQLIREGEVIALLLLIEPSLPHGARLEGLDLVARYRAELDIMPDLLARTRAIGDTLTRKFMLAFDTFLYRALRAARRPVSARTIANYDFRMNVRAARFYRYSMFPGRFTLCEGEAAWRPSSQTARKWSVWADVARDGIDAYTIAGAITHTDVLREPYINEIGRIVTERIRMSRPNT